jgi:hypothetical protein
MKNCMAGYLSTWEMTRHFGPSASDGARQLLDENTENGLMAKKTEKYEIPGRGEIILYRSPDGRAALYVRLDRETVWLNQRQMAELFDKDTDTIGLHIRNICKEGELTRKGTTKESSVVQNEGGRQVRRKVGFYNSAWMKPRNL